MASTSRGERRLVLRHSLIFGFESSSEHSFYLFAAATYVAADVPRQPEFLGLTLHQIRCLRSVGPLWPCRRPA
jgi:hypothetical protein